MALTFRLIYNLTVIMVVLISYSQCMVWSPHPAEHILLHSGMGDRIRRATVRKLVGQGIKAVLKMRGKGRGTQRDAKEVTSRLPEADQCLASLQTGGAVERPSPQFCGWAWHCTTPSTPLVSPCCCPGCAHSQPPASPSLHPCGTELRSRESLDSLQALFSNTSNTGVLSAQF